MIFARRIRVTPHLGAKNEIRRISVGLSEDELGQQRHQLALARHAGLGKHPFEHHARGLLGDNEFLGGFAGR